MKKTLLLTATTAAVFCAPSFANQNYVALELGAGKYNIKDREEYKEDIEKASTLALKAGHYLNDNLRVYGYLQANLGKDSDFKVEDLGLTINIQEEHKSAELGAGADYVHNLTSDLYLLGGANLGIYKDKYKATVNVAQVPGVVTSSEDSHTGAVLGANLGMGYHFTKNFSMEVGYRYSHYMGNEHEIDLAGEKVTMDFESSHMGYLNASYAF